jgi:AcrR family transcriptional regulator
VPVTKGTAIDPARTRAGLLAAATDLLYRRGLDGIGVAELCTSIGVSKETLYRHFGSKDGLVEAVLQARSDRVTAWLADAAAAAGDDPEAQLTAVFDALGRWHAEPSFRGCALLNAATQWHDGHEGTARATAARHLDRRLELLTGIARRAGAHDPATLGRQLLALVVGATVLADLHPGAAPSAPRDAAVALLRAGCPTVSNDQRSTDVTSSEWPHGGAVGS